MPSFLPALLSLVWLTGVSSFRSLPSVSVPVLRRPAFSQHPHASPLFSSRTSPSPRRRLPPLSVLSAQGVTDAGVATREEQEIGVSAPNTSASVEVPQSSNSTALTTAQEPAPELQGSILQRFRKGLRFNKKSLVALGTNFLFTYGFVSNAFYCTSVIAAWTIFSLRYGVTPLAEGKWPYFLAIYGSLWFVGNFMRPIRIAVAAAIAPSFNKLIDFAEHVLHLPRSAAFTAVIIFLNIFCTILYLMGGIALSGLLTGVPVLPDGVTLGAFLAEYFSRRPLPS
uniref:Transmembrane protein n=1 Tax=Chromera velia CCMP2878 TaxID=1169474 RepID=A0A0G4F500_9ALVE|eukprot:Cvel_15106.t1-p1 / transcript=Cvel_15106.t1 / gene=Cvel_15106 / organism=Chromera_velia_CCMP2878 / gene_product=hypothetical protein / transcript_product=hypothetical protein / location=Cvel_scaffold1102:40407-41823(+) / protein_length=281 / sequence_SO=supercontig / SO=protein_coding / is_pseudo=false